MNEFELLELWKSEKHLYDAWGIHVTEQIKSQLISQGKNLELFFKIPPKSRLKSENSLVDKAFQRAKNYDDPYQQIEDKVGVRFVVLLNEDIKQLCSLITSTDEWNVEESRNYEDEREKDPLLFTYQSVHYVIRPKNTILVNELEISKLICCEVQIRTLLQHAHAELTHDAIYKSKRKVIPKVHRTVAKSMALIETTDDFFSQVTTLLDSGPVKDTGILEKLDQLYFNLTGKHSQLQKSSIAIWDVFEKFVTNDLFESIDELIRSAQYSYLQSKIQTRYSDSVIYRQSTVLFIYWLLKNKKSSLLEDWPLSRDILEPLATDMGISLAIY